MLKCAGELKEYQIFFYSLICVLWRGNHTDFVSSVGRACVFSDTAWLKVSLKREVIFIFYFLTKNLSPSVQSQTATSAPRCLVWAFALSLTLLWGFSQQLHASVSDSGSSLWVKGGGPRGADSWQKMWGGLEHVFERRWDVRLRKLLWSCLPRHWEYLHIVWKKIKTKLCKVTAFLFTAFVCTFF